MPAACIRINTDIQLKNAVIVAAQKGKN